MKAAILFMSTIALAAQPAEGRRQPDPKFARLASVAYAIHCQVAEAMVDAQKKGLVVKSVTGSLNLKRTTKNSRQLGIKATVPFEVFEFGPELTYTRTSTTEYGVAFPLDVDPTKPVPMKCKGYTVPTYYASGKAAGRAELTPVVKLDDIYKTAPSNDAKPGEYTEAVTLTAEAKRDAGLTVKILFLKVSVSPKSKVLTTSTGYSVKFVVRTEAFQP